MATYIGLVQGVGCTNSKWPSGRRQSVESCDKQAQVKRYGIKTPPRGPHGTESDSVCF